MLEDVDIFMILARRKRSWNNDELHAVWYSGFRLQAEWFGKLLAEDVVQEVRVDDNVSIDRLILDDARELFYFAAVGSHVSNRQVDEGQVSRRSIGFQLFLLWA